MGKGDIRTRRGKIWRRTYGVTRPRRWKTTTPTLVVKTRKVKALKDLPQAVSEPIMETSVETVNPQVVETQVQSPEVTPPAVVETVPIVHSPVVEAAAKVKMPAVKKAPAVKKIKAKKKIVAKKSAVRKSSSKK